MDVKAQAKKVNENKAVNWIGLALVVLSFLEHFTEWIHFDAVPENLSIWVLAAVAGIKAILGVIPAK